MGFVSLIKELVAAKAPSTPSKESEVSSSGSPLYSSTSDEPVSSWDDEPWTRAPPAVVDETEAAWSCDPSYFSPIRTAEDFYQSSPLDLENDERVDNIIDQILTGSIYSLAEYRALVESLSGAERQQLTWSLSKQTLDIDPALAEDLLRIARGAEVPEGVHGDQARSQFHGLWRGDCEPVATVYFATGDAGLTEDDREVLQQVLADMGDAESFEMYAKGSADRRGYSKPGGNDALSGRRSHSVSRYLGHLALPRNIEFEGRSWGVGEVGDSDDAGSLQRARRVDLYIRNVRWPTHEEEAAPKPDPEPFPSEATLEPFNYRHKVVKDASVFSKGFGKASETIDNVLQGAVDLVAWALERTIRTTVNLDDVAGSLLGSVLDQEAKDIVEPLIDKVCKTSVARLSKLMKEAGFIAGLLSIKDIEFDLWLKNEVERPGADSPAKYLFTLTGTRLAADISVGQVLSRLLAGTELTKLVVEIDIAITEAIMEVKQLIIEKKLSEIEVELFGSRYGSETQSSRLARLKGALECLRQLQSADSSTDLEALHQWALDKLPVVYLASILPPAVTLGSLLALFAEDPTAGALVERDLPTLERRVERLEELRTGSLIDDLLRSSLSAMRWIKGVQDELESAKKWLTGALGGDVDKDVNLDISSYSLSIEYHADSFRRFSDMLSGEVDFILSEQVGTGGLWIELKDLPQWLDASRERFLFMFTTSFARMFCDSSNLDPGIPPDYLVKQNQRAS